jgi:hypothetical protein
VELAANRCCSVRSFRRRRRVWDGGRMDSESAQMRGRKIGFLGGGNMAGALIRGLLHVAPSTADQIRASDVNERAPERAAHEIRHRRLRRQRGPRELGRRDRHRRQAADRRPHPPAHRELAREGDLVISIAAGVPIDAIEARLPSGDPRDARHAQHRGDRARRGHGHRPRDARDEGRSCKRRRPSSTPSGAASCSTSPCSTR